MDKNRKKAPQGRLGFMVYRAGLAIARGYERALEPLALTPVESGVLLSLANDGPSHVRGLARLLGVGRQTIVNVTKRLEAGSQISRSLHDSDARLVVYGITRHGRRKIAAIERLSSVFDNQLRNAVGSAVEPDLIARMQRIVDAPFLAYEN